MKHGSDHPEWAPDESNLHMAGLLSARFRRGMVPLALGTGLCVALAAPVADFVLERHDISRRAHQLAVEAASRVARLPALSDAATAARDIEQTQEEILRVDVLGADGRTVITAPSPRTAPSWPLIRGEAPIIANGRPLGTVAITVGEHEWLYRDELLLGVFGLLGVVLGLALYFFPLRLFREDDLVRLFAWRSIKAAEEERLRLSRELHDGVGQSLGAAAVAIARLGTRVGRVPEVVESARLIDGALDEVRRVARGLRPPTLDDLGLGAAVASLAREVAGAGLEVDIEIGELPRINPDVEQTCFRLAQEALANVVRHASARRVRVMLGQEAENVVLEVQDDGRGFSPSSGLGLGLVGARERAARLAGVLSIESNQGRGTRLRAVLPMRATA